MITSAASTTSNEFVWSVSLPREPDRTASEAMPPTCDAGTVKDPKSSATLPDGVVSVEKLPRVIAHVEATR